jgi:hypothetical protein
VAVRFAVTLINTMNLSRKISLVTRPRLWAFGMRFRLASFAAVCSSPFFA